MTRSRASAKATEWTLQLPYSKPPLNMNQRLHWAPKARITAQIVSDVQLLATSMQLPRGLHRVEVELVWTPTVRRCRDTDNPSPTLKAAIDGLVRYGLVPDDNSAHVTSRVVITDTNPTASLALRITDLAALLSGTRPQDET